MIFILFVIHFSIFVSSILSVPCTIFYYNGNFLHYLFINLIGCIAQDIMSTSIQYVLDFNFTAKIPLAGLHMSKRLDLHVSLFLGHLLLRSESC